MRPKGNLTQLELALLFVAATVPLLVVAVRVAALPGVLGPELGWTGLTALGNQLDQMLSLQSVPPGDRDRVLYLLLLPTSAVLIALARLTLGIRVIGFRAILISIGFQEIGFFPSLILIAVMVAVVMAVRPALLRIRLPRYARLAVTLCLSVLVLLFAMLASPWLHSEVMWRASFFPVIVLGLLAESIVKTLDQDSGLVAAWRTGMTIGTALLISVICQIALVREVALHFPELVLTQIAAIVLIAEFLDLRLLQDWDARLSGVAVPRLIGGVRGLRIALVRNRRRNGVIARLGPPGPRAFGRRSVRRIAAALRENGHTVRVLEGDMSLLGQLSDFIPAHPRTGEPGGLVLCLAPGIQGEAPASHVPAMLEMAGFAYVGSPPQGQAVASDGLLLRKLLQQSGVPIPPYRSVATPGEGASGLRYPLVVEPRFAPGSARVVGDRLELKKAIEALLEEQQQPAIVAEATPGREIHVALLGNDPVETLPPVELQAGRLGRICPAPLDTALLRAMRERARKAFSACACRDYALVALRVPDSGEPLVVGVDALGMLDAGGSFELAAARAGYTLPGLLDRILDIARERYRAEGRPTAADTGLGAWVPREPGRSPAVAG
ncbi:MAG: 7TM domain-containing protein [Myxococcota bacterium]|nr:7TM domain-containing protein [Myxococcota bacterium]